MHPDVARVATPTSLAIEKMRQSWRFASTKLNLYSVQRGGVVTKTDLTASVDPEITGAGGLQTSMLDDAPGRDDPVQLLLSLGGQNLGDPLRITPGDFSCALKWIGFSSNVLTSIPVFTWRVPHFLEYDFEFESTKNPSTQSPEMVMVPKALHLAFKIDLREHAYVMGFLRYCIGTRRLKGMVFECQPLSSHHSTSPFQPLFIFENLLRERSMSLKDEPLRLLGSILEICESCLRSDFSVSCRELLECESMVGVTRRQTLMRNLGFEFGSKDYEQINKKLFNGDFEFGKYDTRCKVLHLFGTELQNILRRLTSQSNGNNTHANIGAIKLIEDTIRRVDVDTIEVNFAQQRIWSLSSVLHSLINQRDSGLNYEVAKAAKSDSAAMRTISALTLLYLPATFVSAVFSTTIFNFQNWSFNAVDDAESSRNSGRNKVVSPAWWIYFLSCVLLTIATNAVWQLWKRRDSRTLEGDSAELQRQPSGDDEKHKIKEKPFVKAFQLPSKVFLSRRPSS